MKNSLLKYKYFSLLILFFAIVSDLKAQGISTIKPTDMVWFANNNKITLTQAVKEGIKVPDSLKFVVRFDNELLKSNKNEKLQFEFKWYYYFSTRKQLMDSYVIELSDRNNDKTNGLQISSSRGKIKSGWWEVQVISKKDRGILDLKGTSQFQIWVK